MTINDVSTADSPTAANCSEPQLKRLTARLKEFLPPVDPAPFGVSGLLSANEPRLPYGPPPVWQISMRNPEAPAASRPRNYLWIRRPVHRGGAQPHRRLRETLGEAKILPTIVLFSTFMAIALGLSMVR